MSLHPDILQRLSIVIDFDDVGEDEMRRRKVEEVVQTVRDCKDVNYVYKFSIEEKGWNIQFSIDVEPGLCRLRLSDRYDFDSRKIDAFVNSKRQKYLSVQLPPSEKISTEDLLAGVMSFLVLDVMDE